MSDAERLQAINHPDRALLDHADTSQIGAALLALTREVWTLTDRMMVTEEVLKQRGIDIAGEIDAFQPDAAMQQRLDAAGERLVASVLDALAGLPADPEGG